MHAADNAYSNDGSNDDGNNDDNTASAIPLSSPHSGPFPLPFPAASAAAGPLYRSSHAYQQFIKGIHDNQQLVDCCLCRHHLNSLSTTYPLQTCYPVPAP